MQTPGRAIEEQWMAPRGHAMLGMSRTVRGDSLVDYEMMVMRERDGAVAYEAHPKDQPAATFPARMIADSSVLFENLEHDFPQRIGYERHGPDSLVAWVEGPSGGGGRSHRIEFPYRRARCGTP